jgi:hypothetical protein
MENKIHTPSRCAVQPIYGQHPSPGTPGTWDREIWWVLNRSARVGNPVGRNRWRLAPPFTMHGLRVTAGQPRKPYGRSTGKNSYLSHLPTTVLFAWRDGQLVGHMVAWRCGARTAYFRLIDEPDSPICPVCLIDRSSTRRPT